MKIEGKVALITGASEGIGAACAAEFRRAGALLSLTARNEAGLRTAGGADALITPGDLTLEETRRAAVERTLERFGRIDVLINNAGLGLYMPAWQTPLDEARRLWELNFFVALHLCQLAVPAMRVQGSGSIVNVSSIAGRMTLPWLTLYSASKSALGALTEGLRMELLGAGVHAMLVCPGYVHTGFQSHARGGGPPKALVQGKRFAITAEQCARDIRRGVERGARTVVTPGSCRLLIAAGRLFGGVVERRLAGINGTA
jgi:short-subunit dehydrogenase